MAQVGTTEGLKPRVMDVGSNGPANGEKEDNQGMRLKKELGLLNGIAIIVGVILGSGIFVSPSKALTYAGSKGLAILIWVFSGILSMFGALCYAELGTMIPESGGDYAYIGEAFGPCLGFLYLWGALLILVPGGNAITALTFAQNILKSFFPDCDPDENATLLIAALVTCLLSVINCYNVKWVTRAQDSFTLAKILAIIVIFLAGVAYLFSTTTEHLENLFENTSPTTPGGIALCFYTCLFSYSGWNYLNFVTEELKEPDRNLPRAICISIPLVTLVYVLTNVAYFAVLTADEITSDAFAIVFSQKALGVMSWIMSVIIALCTLGSLNGAIYASSRLYFVGARNGHLPLAISLIDVERHTPVPSIIFMCLATLAMMLVGDMNVLIVFVTAAEIQFITCSVAGLLWMRYRQPSRERRISVPIVLPIIFLIICAFLIVYTLMESGIAGFSFFITILGIPVYWFFIKWQNKPKGFTTFCDSLTLNCSKFFNSLPAESKDL